MSSTFSSAAALRIKDIRLDIGIHELLCEPDFCATTDRVLGAAAQHSREGRRSLRRTLSTKSVQQLGAIALRGSYAKGTATPRSDIDITVVSDNVGTALNVVRSAIRGKFCSVSFLAFPTNYTRESIGDLVHWLSIPCLRFVGGDKRFFNEFIRIAHRTLATKELNELLELFAFDPFRSRHLSTTNRWNLKRDPGGTLEYEFVQLYKLWLFVRGQTPTELETELFKEFECRYQFLETYRILLHKIRNQAIETVEEGSGCDRVENYGLPWFFSSRIVRRVLIENRINFRRLLAKMCL